MGDGTGSRLPLLLGAIGVRVIQSYLRVFGRTVRKADVPWLLGPIGSDGQIGDGPYQEVATREGLTIKRHASDAGLVPDFNVLAGPEFDPASTAPEVRRFYEQTSRYSGFYTTVKPPGHVSPCVKVVFPVPRGSATVVLRPEHGADGRFHLVSGGRRFGDPGFYRILELDAERLKVRHMKTLRERFDVYVDDDGVLRCNHHVRFAGMTMLRLHYRIRPHGRG